MATNYFDQLKRGAIICLKGNGGRPSYVVTEKRDNSLMVVEKSDAEPSMMTREEFDLNFVPLNCPDNV